MALPLVDVALYAIKSPSNTVTMPVTTGQLSAAGVNLSEQAPGHPTSTAAILQTSSSSGDVAVEVYRSDATLCGRTATPIAGLQVVGVRTIPFDIELTQDLVAGEPLLLLVSHAATGAYRLLKSEALPGAVKKGTAISVAFVGGKVQAAMPLTLWQGYDSMYGQGVTINLTADPNPQTPETPKATQIQLHPAAEISIPVGEARPATATVLPEGASQSVKWVSSDTSVATVANGTITAKGAGTCRVTAEALDGSGVVSDPLTVTVLTAPILVTSLELEPSTTQTIQVGATRTFKAIIKPDNASNPSVAWTTNNSSIATVAAGVVTAHKVGTCQLSARTSDGTNRVVNLTINVVPEATHTVDWIEPIFDRTQNDVDQAKIAIAEGFDGDLKGCLNPSDLNRIENNVTYLNETVDVLGILKPTPFSPKTYTYSDYLTTERNSEIIARTKSLVQAVLKEELTLTGFLTFQDLNEIEYTLYRVKEAL